MIAVTSSIVAAEAVWIWGPRVFGAHVARADSRSPRTLPPATVVPPDAPPLATPPAAALAPAPFSDAAPGPQRILVFGDSMVINMVQPLSDYCKANGHHLFPAIQYGSTTIGWGSNGHLEQLIAMDKPTLILVVVGSSELFTTKVEYSERFIKRMLAKMGDIPSIWIGPANWRPDTGINDAIARNVGPGRFFRSAELVLPREADGIHPMPEGSRKWVDAFAQWTPHSIAPSLFAKPVTGRAPKVQALVYDAAYATPPKPRPKEALLR
jgi:hypothetical protein